MKIRYNYIFIPILVIIVALFVWLNMKNRESEDARLLVDRALLEFDQVSAIEIVSAETTIKLERQVISSEGLGSSLDWLITEPFHTGVSADSFDAFVQALTEAKSARDIVGLSPEQQSEYGLDEPAWRVTMMSESGTALFDLVVGIKTPDETSWYTAFGDRLTECYLIPIYSIEPMMIEPGEIRDTHAMVFNRDDMQFIQLSSVTAEIHLEREESGDWIMTYPESFGASPNRMDKLFHDIEELASVSFIEPGGEFAELSQLNVEVMMTAGDGSRYELSIRGENTDRDAVRGGFFATSSYQPTPFTVEDYIYDDLAIAPENFFKALLIDFPTDQIQTIVVRQPGTNLEIERTGEGMQAWSIVKPDGRVANSPADFENFLSAMFSIRPEAIIPPPEHPGDYGIDPAYWVKIEVAREPGQEGAEIYFGNQNDDGYYYATQDRISYFLVSERIVQQFMTSNNVLKGSTD